MFARLRSLFRALTSRRDFETGMTEELHFHIEQYASDLVRSGIPLGEARRRARLEFGGMNTIEENCREARGLRIFNELEREFRYAARQLGRSRGFTATVVLTLALSIGANTAIFSVVNALLLKSLPYAHPERMGTIYERVTGAHGSDGLAGIDGERWELLRDGVPALISAVSGGTTGVNLKAAARVQYVQDGRVSAHYFDVLAIQPIVGRNFSEDEDRPHGPEAAILSYNVWRNFGFDPNIIGQAIQLRSEPYTVVGVLPQGATTPLNADVYTSLQPSRQGEGGGTNFEVITRVRNGSTWQEANAQLSRAWALLARRMEARLPGARVTFYSVPLQKGETDSLRPQVLALMLAAGFILLIACANLAGLTLVRILRRAPEVATRLALGATGWQIQKQFWVENLLLTLVSGAVAVGVGFLGLRGILLLLPKHFLPVESVSLDGRVMAFTLAASVLTSVLFGMLPTLASRKVDLRSSMTGRGEAKVGNVRLRQALIAGEVALTVVLLAASGLLIRSLIHLETLAPGFNPNGVMVAKASLDDVRYHDPAAFRKLLDDSTAAMRQIPGVMNAAVGLSLPWERALNDMVTLSDGKEAGRQDGTDVVYVTPGYFDTLQMHVLEGRAFTDADGPNTQHVAVVNQAFARRFYGGSNPVGRYIDKDTVLVGEVADVPVSSGLYEGAPLMIEQAMYIPATQVNAQYLSLVHVWFQPDWVVRTAVPVQGLMAALQRALASADPNLPASGFYSMKDLLGQTLAAQRIEVALLGAMAALAMLLSGVGIFALVANIVAHRTREIGIRMALGSTIQTAMVQVCKSGMGASAMGLGLGLVLCAGALRVMRSVLYGVGVYDAPTILVVVLALAAVTLLAAAVPALRVARINPATTLREE
jgi:predicted permease